VIDTVLRVAGATVSSPEVQGAGELAIWGGSLLLTDASTLSHITALTAPAGGGTLSGAGDLVVASTLTWTAGTMSGSGRTVLGSGVTGSITGGTLARTLVNRGALTASTGSWFGTSSAVLDNEGTFTTNIPINNGMGMRRSPAGATPQIHNSGVFRTTLTAPSITTVEWQIDNTGTVQPTTGAATIQFSGGGVAGLTGSGSWSTTQLSGNYTWGPASTLTGSVALTGGQLTAPDLQGTAGDLTVNGTTLTLTDAATMSRLRSLTMGPSSATLTGPADLTISAGLAWSNGTMSGSGSTILSSSASGSIGGNVLPILSRTLINHGALSAQGDFSWKGTSAALFDNHGTFTQNILPFAGRGLEPAATGDTPRIRNYGTVNKTTTSSTSSNINWRFDNYGAVLDAGQGTIRFGGGTTPSANATGSWAGATFQSGTFTLGAGTELTGAVTAAFASVTAPDVQGSGDLTVYGASLTLSDPDTTSHVKTLTVNNSGLLTGPGDLTVSTTFSWTNGVMAGTGTTTLAAAATGTLTPALGTALERRLVNRGHLAMYQGKLTGRAGAVIDNQGILDLSGQDYQPSLEAQNVQPRAQLWNRAMIIKSSGTPQTSVDWAFANQGVIQPLTSGTLNFTGPSIGTGVGSDGSVPAGDSESYGDHSDVIPGVSHCAGADPVNCTTGNFYEELADIAIAGRGRPLLASRTYNAKAAEAESAGLTSDSQRTRLSPGWTHAYATRLELLPGYVKLHGANDATALFKQAAGATFTAPERVKAHLARGENDSYILTYKDQTKDVFDATGRLLRQIDRNAYATSLTYDAQGRIDHVSDEAGRQLTYSYDTSGRISQITDPLGRDVAYAYDAHGDLVTVTDVAGETHRYGYDDQHRIVSMRDPRDNETTNTYDAEGRVTKQVDACNGVTRFAYADASTTVTNPRGFKTRYELLGGLTSKVVRGVGTAQQSTVAMVHDASGNVTQRTDPDDQITTVDYDGDGNATQITDPLDRVTTMTYSADNDLRTITDPSSTTTTITYDATGNVETVSRPLTGSLSTATTTFGYDPDKPGDVISWTDPNDNTWNYAYDADGNQVSATDPEGNATTAVFNAIGWRTSSVSPRGNTMGADPEDFKTILDYDDHGLPLTITDPTGAITTMTYDASGNQISVTKPGANTTTTSYDELNRPTLVTRNDDSTLRFGYDANGNRTSLKDGLNHETTFTYDPLDRESSTTDPASRTTSYTYDASSRQKTITDAMSRTTTLTYDAGSQLQQLDYSDSQTASVDFDYDGLGRRSAMTDGSGTSSYTYDSLGRLKTRTDPSNRTIAYAYDLANRLTKTTYPAALVDDTLPAGASISEPAVTRGYDDAGRVISITDWLQHETQFDYDANDNLREQSYPNGTTATFDYDYADRLTRRTDNAPGNSEILDLGYTRKLNGQLHTQNRTGQTPPQTDTLTYDDLDQLTGATLAANNDAYTYQHDTADRLTQISTPDTSTTLEYDAASQLVRTRNANTNQQLTAFSYESVGNRTAQDPAGTVGATTYDYDQAGRLTQFQAPAADPNDPDVQRSYAYDGDGLRSDLLWDTSTELPLIVGDGAGLYITGPDGLPLTQLTFDGQQRYYHHDQLGSTRAITDVTGTVSARYNFDPYGNPTDSSGTTDNRFGYAGQYTDPVSGLIYMRARWYDPTTGQFLSRDPLEVVTGAPYGYAGNDPVNQTDPTGLCPWCVVGAVIVAKAAIAVAIDLGAQALANIADGCGPFQDISISSLGISAALGTIIPGGGAAGRAAKGANAARTVSTADKATELRALAGRNRVSIETPSGRLSVDLAGKSHFEKSLGHSVDTPHVKFETRHVGPDGRVSYTSGPVRDATQADLRIVARVLAERGR